MKKLFLKFLVFLRKSFLGKGIIKFLIKLHNFSYHWIGFFCVRDNIHPKHRLMNYHQFFVDNINKEDVVLDVGCGNGALTCDLAKKAKKVVGIDINKKNIALAKKRFLRDNIEYICGDILTLIDKNKGLRQSAFTVIILSNVLEHIKDRIEFLKDLASQHPKAKFLIRVPMINRDWLTLYKKELGAEWRLDKTHFTEYTLESFKEELQKANLKIDKFSIQFGEIWAAIC